MSERVAERLAQNLALQAAGRIAMVIGLPVVIGLTSWMLLTVHGLAVRIETFPQHIVAVQGQVGNVDRRVDGLDDRVKRLEQPFFLPRSRRDD